MDCVARGMTLQLLSCYHYALFTFRSMHFFLKTFIFDDVFYWLLRLFLPLLPTLFLLISGPLCVFLLLFKPNFFGRTEYKSKRKRHSSSADSLPLFDARLMVLQGIQISPPWVYLLITRASKLYVQVKRLYFMAYDFLSRPFRLRLSTPPHGILTSIVLISSLVIALLSATYHTSVVSTSLQQSAHVTTVLSSSMADSSRVSFDTDSFEFVLDNSANTHICNDRRLFTSYQEYSITKGGVATIDGKDLPPSGVGTGR